MSKRFFDLTEPPAPAMPTPDLSQLEARIEDVFTMVYAMYLQGATR